MSPIDPVTEAQIEGAMVEAECAAAAFHSAAANTILNMELNIIREFPEFYSQEDRIRAGVPGPHGPIRLDAPRRLWRWLFR